MQTLPRRLAALLDGLRAEPPLVHNITNWVAMDLSANLLLAAGASPAMVHAESEVEEFVTLAGALVVNIGTFDEHWTRPALAAAEAARSRGVPWVLDPVAVGVTGFRTRNACDLALLGPDCIRANASEVLALAAALETKTGTTKTAPSLSSSSPSSTETETITAAPSLSSSSLSSSPLSTETETKTAPSLSSPPPSPSPSLTTTETITAAPSSSPSIETARGVDSVAGTNSATHAARKLARHTNSVVLLTGADDFAADKHTLIRIRGGDPLLARVTATGCALSAATAALLAAAKHTDTPQLTAVTAASLLFAAAAEHAARNANGPGSFRTAFIDAIADIASDTTEQNPVITMSKTRVEVVNK
ncbi:MAG: hydroxyethylthiazole kinase [Alphaproteobacteria bacterium]|nr:hydroxyethylthiazole kinase [Alphaproteobacteria bacterium]